MLRPPLPPDTPVLEGTHSGSAKGSGVMPPAERHPAVPQPQTAADLTYGAYLAVDELLRLQRPLSEAHDELEFIVVHQVFELWFRLLLHELETVRDTLDRDDVRAARALLLRCSEIVTSLVATLPLLETMRPSGFLEFRARLGGASGLQSRQFREIEFLSGLRDPRYLRLFDRDPENRAVLERRLREPTVWDAALGVFARRGLPTQPEGRLVDALAATHGRPEWRDLDDLVDALLEYDSRFALWRYRHLLMVERLIGGRAGTGEADVRALEAEKPSPAAPEAAPLPATPGAAYPSGAAYLQRTLPKRFFPLLWQSRTRIGT
ncbi:MAG: tryptophan 2,3-dioxygenase family protein [Armatimonadota bacterium]|nr:tryptophan 2,3-dioxygenase family protein [Armatimonadota bacterium]MDR7585932.1 tryptophan 2,3-dioxygenase family protein [Armatimonadota bacterium]